MHELEREKARLVAEKPDADQESQEREKHEMRKRDSKQQLKEKGRDSLSFSVRELDLKRNKNEPH